LHVAGPVQKLVTLRLGQLLPRHVEPQPDLLDDAAAEVRVHALRVLLETRGPGQEGALFEREILVGDDELFGGDERLSESAAVGAGALRVVPGEELRRELGEGRPALGADALVAVRALLAVAERRADAALTGLQRGLDGVRQPRARGV